MNPAGPVGRGVPDVSGDADPNTGYNILVDGKAMPIGGTSAVAPLWAGLVTLLNQKLGKPVGFLNPILYANPGALNDITQGSNGDYNAGPGWDPCTGLGSPNGMKLLAVLSGTATPQARPPQEENADDGRFSRRLNDVANPPGAGLLASHRDLASGHTC